ncbi:hypothetical protein EDD11_008696 [Mortierella claussenii]|nr:hypothetical protein EDD11_008696 [Mortierella claussenii]
MAAHQADPHKKSVDVWRAAGKPLPQDATTRRPDKVQLTWETCTKAGPAARPERSIISPYVAEGGAPVFEAAYQRLLAGIPSSIFTYNSESMKFELEMDSFRIEGCSAAAISKGMSLVRIAFGRSLSSYLTFLQGTIVELQETSRRKQTFLLDLHHRTNGMGVILGRLAYLCQCHIEQNMADRKVTRFGYYLPPGADLLSVIYEEIVGQPSSSDPLWVALLLSLLDQASKPYRDILSRWLGTIPSTAHSRSDLFNDSSAGVQEPNKPNGGKLSMFDCHLQESLQGLDPFNEFFVHSQHLWTWDGSEPIILADPLDYESEFQRSARILPPTFMSDVLAEKVMEAGKELQILAEFEPRHPLIAYDRSRGMDQRGNGIEWLYVQEDVIRNKQGCAQSTAKVLQAVATRLEDMGWKRRLAPVGRKQRRQAQKQIAEAFRIGSCESFFGSAAGMDVEMDFAPARNEEDMLLRLGLDPDLQGFFSLSPSMGQVKDVSLACPDMMAFFLRPEISSPSSSDFNSAVHTTTTTRLDNTAPMIALADQSFSDSILSRTSLINTCVLSLYFHDLNLLGHLQVLERFMLMRDGNFVARVSQALFEEETGLLTRSARAATAAKISGVSGGSQKEDSRRGSTSSMATPAFASAWRSTRLIWPPRSGELEMALRAVLLDCFQASSAADAERKDFSKEEDDPNMSDMHAVEDRHTSRTRQHRDDINSPMQRSIDSAELEESLAFAVQEYDDEHKISRDANALEALDFLYLEYKAPRPLRLLFFTPNAFEKYTRLFTFQLRLMRVDASLKRIYGQLRARQKMAVVLQKTSRTASLGQCHPALAEEMRVLHRFRFEAHQVFKAIQGYVADVAMNTTWRRFMQRMSTVQARVEHQIIMSRRSDSDPHLESNYTDFEALTLDADDNLSTAAAAAADQGLQDSCLEDLAALQQFHDRVLDQMLSRSLLKRRQAPVLKVVHGILSSILKLSQYLDRLDLESTDTTNAMMDEDVHVDTDAAVEKRLQKLKSMYEKFQSMCAMLVKVLKVLNERGHDVEHGTNADVKSRMSSGDGYLRQLLLRLNMTGFYDA